MKVADEMAATIENAARALTNIQSTTADVTEAKAEQNAERPDTRSNAERAEGALHRAIAGAITVWDSICAIATAQPKKDDGVARDVMPMLLLAAPDGIAKLIDASSMAINTAVEGFRQLAALRIEEAAALPGAQTIYPPGHGPHAESSRADGLHGERGYPSLSAIEAIDQALKDHREGKP